MTSLSGVEDSKGDADSAQEQVYSLLGRETASGKTSIYTPNLWQEQDSLTHRTASPVQHHPNAVKCQWIYWGKAIHWPSNNILQSASGIYLMSSGQLLMRHPQPHHGAVISVWVQTVEHNGRHKAVGQ